MPVPETSPPRTLSSLGCLAWLVLSSCGGGGGGGGSLSASTSSAATTLSGAELAVLVAQGDATSEAIGAAYKTARGVPDAQVFRVRLPPSVGDAINADDFAALRASVEAGLPSNVQATLLTWTRPSRVVGATCSMSITSAMAFGYDARYCAAGCLQTAASPYYNGATRAPFSDLRMRPSMMLGVATLAEAQTLIARGVAADATWTAGSAGASGQAFLLRTSDAARSTRWPDFQALASASVAGLSIRYIDNSAGRASDEVTGQNDVMFYLTGLPGVPGAASNRYLPGAVADTLSSYGGYLPDAMGQMPVTDWLKSGATASYGTVEEPCNYVEKFPRASVLVAHYRNGETLLEAYWKSVQWPGQGLFIGEPLAHPWAAR